MPFALPVGVTSRTRWPRPSKDGTAAAGGAGRQFRFNIVNRIRVPAVPVDRRRARRGAQGVGYRHATASAISKSNRQHRNPSTPRTAGTGQGATGSLVEPARPGPPRTVTGDATVGPARQQHRRAAVASAYGPARHQGERVVSRRPRNTPRDRDSETRRRCSTFRGRLARESYRRREGTDNVPPRGTHARAHARPPQRSACRQSLMSSRGAPPRCPHSSVQPRQPSRVGT